MIRSCINSACRCWWFIENVPSTSTNMSSIKNSNLAPFAFYSCLQDWNKLLQGISMRNGFVKCRKLTCLDRWNFQKRTRIKITQKVLAVLQLKDWLYTFLCMDSCEVLVSNILFFLHQNQNIFFSNIGNQNIFFRKKT